MTIRTFKCDPDKKKTTLDAYMYRGIGDELSSVDTLGRDITRFILRHLYGRTMWFTGDCEVKSSAKCADGDNYSEKVGKEVCNVKADLKYHKMMYDRYLGVVWTLSMLKFKLEKLMNMHQEKIERLEKDLDQYVR